MPAVPDAPAPPSVDAGSGNGSRDLAFRPWVVLNGAKDWLADPKPPSVTGIITFSVVAAAVLFTLFQLSPSLLVANTTPSGGDTGSHVWGPYFLRHHLLPQGRIIGWAPDWYAGFPAYHFYFPLPALMIVFLDVFLPYGVAFKLITVSGVLALPVAAYVFGRLSGMRFPGPPMLALATVPFLFDRGFSIYGGNIASTLAGEFSFTIGLAFALVFLGFVARGLDTGRNRAAAAVVLALAGLSHLLPTIFAVVGACILLLLRPGRRRVWVVGTVFATGALLAAFWSFPFLMRLRFANNMGWEKITEYQKNLFPPGTRWVQWLALAGVVSAFVLRRRVGLFLVGMATISGALFIVAPESRLWNARVLPFWYLALYMLAAVAIAEAGPELGRLLARDPEKPSPWAAALTPIVAAIAVWIVVGLPLKVLPTLPAPKWLILVVAAAAVGAAGYRVVTGAALIAAVAVTGILQFFLDRATPLFKLSLFLLVAVAVTEAVLLGVRAMQARDARYGHEPQAWLQAVTPVVGALLASFIIALPLGLVPQAFNRPTTTDSSFIPGWAKWNYKGYERKDAFPEYEALLDTMKSVGRERGCGRAHWEYESGLDRFGTPMALMLLPFWTKGCIGSMEGLYFESSATVPYHFLSAGELSKAPSNPQRDLPYKSMNENFELGIEHLQMLGARYYMAFSSDAITRADRHPDLTRIATGPNLPAASGEAQRRWQIYELAGSELVSPLEFEPAVMQGPVKGERQWMGPSVKWYMDETAHDVFLAESGPENWPRVRVSKVATTSKTVGDDVRIANPPRHALEPVVVSNIRSDDSNISFDVDRTGVPVLVKASYFPPWKVSGGDGPWRVTPNLMVVVPESKHVKLHYGYTASDFLGWAFTFTGVGLAIAMARKGVVDYSLPPRPWRRSRAATGDPAGAGASDAGDSDAGDGQAPDGKVADGGNGSAAKPDKRRAGKPEPPTSTPVPGTGHES